MSFLLFLGVREICGFLLECKVINVFGENGCFKFFGGWDVGSGGMFNLLFDWLLGLLLVGKFGGIWVLDFGVLELIYGGVFGEIGKLELEEVVEEFCFLIDLNLLDLNIIFGLCFEFKVCNLLWFIVICCCLNFLSNKNCFSFVEFMIKEWLVLFCKDKEVMNLWI